MPASPSTAGRVILVGAGPGDPDLLTLKARGWIERADSILYDELVQSAVLDWARPDCEKLYVGKRDRAHSLPQGEIERLLIARARRGWTVVRLKGGDPFLFGRGGEEAEALTAAGAAWEVVPGVSAGLAVPALADIPITHRGVASSVLFRTGHRDPEAAESAAATAPPGRDADDRKTTQVVFMGLAHLPALARDFVRRGWAATTPAAVISRGSLPGQLVITGTLADIAPRAAAARASSPALIIVGEVVGLRAGLRRGPAAAEDPASSSAAEARGREPGLIVMAHGSPVASWHESVERLVAELSRAGGWVRAAYLPPAEPQLATIVAEAAAARLARVVVVPYFLAEGLHVTRDIPEMVAVERARFPSLRLDLAASLDGHPALRTALLARAAEATALP